MKRFFTYDILAERTGRNGKATKIANNTYAHRAGCTRLSIAVNYHQTTVAFLYPDKSVTLSSGGWIGNYTTKERLNWFAEPIGWHVFQKDFRVYIWNYENGKTYAWVDGLRIWPDGRIFDGYGTPLEEVEK